MGPLEVPAGEIPRCHPMSVKFNAIEAAHDEQDDDWLREAFERGGGE